MFTSNTLKAPPASFPQNPNSTSRHVSRTATLGM
ncbi:hypothetical protein BP1026B_II2538 [Burkholderia pseudomallei 1026b]|uniref:Uncharacterized protein n=1 Tax=Burkholderia pseudomallei (strain 1026b) TaxID=884204 RepID=A0A0H3HXV9_BURP2|nr:hypothetical protein BP1026B_II2538 [Burkholderia pseudomallei 1026b]